MPGITLGGVIQNALFEALDDDDVIVAVPVIVPDLAVIVEVPVPISWASPLFVIVATDVLDELQIAVDVRLPVEPSEYVPVAVNCWEEPLATL